MLVYHFPLCLLGSEQSLQRLVLRLNKGVGKRDERIAL